MLTERDNGFYADWLGRVWLNPPFGRKAYWWLEKLAQHGDGIALIPARTETEMFYKTVWGRAHAICFVKGRPHFHYPNGDRAKFNSGAPIALVAYGACNAEALKRANLGVTLPLHQNGKGASQ